MNDLFSSKSINPNFKINLERPLIFLDLETTGIDTFADRIVEIAMLKVNADGTKTEFEQVVNPLMPIPKGASDVHGFTDEMVKDKPPFSAIAKDVEAFMEDGDLAGFNSNRFDIPMLVEELMRAGVNIQIENRKSVDVQRIFHKQEPRNLEAAVKFYCEQELKNAHSAMADVKATYDVLVAQLQRYPNLKNEVDFLEKFSEDAKFIDVARRLVFKNGKVCYNFGKHKDKPVADVLRTEPQYYDWMMKSDFPLHTKHKLKEIVEALRK
ncbi:MAG: hypothetical protein RIQ33_2058 [Bacteroidota bacterium]